MTDRHYPSRPWVGIGVVAFDGARVLLVRRGKPPRLGSWSIPGGAQELGETTEDAARRELREETGIEVGPLSLVAVIDSIARDTDGAVQYHYTIIDYAAQLAGGAALPGDDVAAVAWAAPEELEAYDLTPEALRVIALARRILAGDR